MKKLVFAVVAMAVTVSAVAQVKGRWGSIDVRYPLDCKAEVSDHPMNLVSAWRGERVNLQLVVTNEYAEKDCSVEYRFSDLRAMVGKKSIPASKAALLDKNLQAIKIGYEYEG